MTDRLSRGGKKMWCVPDITPEFTQRMEHILDLYAMPYNPQEPLLCFDEKSIQLLEDTHRVSQTKEGIVRKRDYEYKRNGTANIFVAVEPQAGFRTTRVTNRRTKKDFAHEIWRIATLPRYRHAHRIRIVLDNLNTHYASSLIETFGEEKTKKIMERIVFHYTPKHASWLNMAEIEISILSRQCLKQRIPSAEKLREKLAFWQKRRNHRKEKIQWRFTKQDARNVFKYSPTKLI